MNLSKQCEDLLNKQINLELQAHYNYLILYSYFKKDSVAYFNVAKYFKKSSDEELEHATKFIDYQNIRGGFLSYSKIDCIDMNLINTENPILHSFEIALDLENNVYRNLLNLHKMADDNNDPQLCDFLESNFLEEQVESIYELKSYITQLKTLNNDKHALWNFDNKLN